MTKFYLIGAALLSSLFLSLPARAASVSDEELLAAASLIPGGPMENRAIPGGPMGN